MRATRAVRLSPLRTAGSRPGALLVAAIGVSGLLSGPSVAAADNDVATLSDAFAGGSFEVGFRYRFEHVDQDAGTYGGMPFTREANASTLRTRLVYTTAEFNNFYLTLNVDDLRPLVGRNFNDTRNGKSQYPLVADPKGTDLNIAALTYTGLEDGTVVLGRQRIIRENARFVGNVGWRQNEQTYDSFSIDYAINDRFQAFYAYIDRVKRIFGPDDGTPAASLDSESHLLDASYTFGPALRVSGYGYWLDFDDAMGLSSETQGLRLTGSVGDDATRFSYAAEFAQQEDYKDNPNDYKENYLHLMAGVDWPKYGIKAGFESLGGGGSTPTDFGQAFSTPLATLHKFNGRADQFLQTPGTGLEDRYVEGTVAALGGKITLTYHDFAAESGGGDLGTEVDLFASWAVLENYTVTTGIASFDADASFLSDVTKVWLMLSADF